MMAGVLMELAPALDTAAGALVALVPALAGPVFAMAARLDTPAAQADREENMPCSKDPRRRRRGVPRPG